jgi:cytochrome c oxidase subunit 3
MTTNTATEELDILELEHGLGGPRQGGRGRNGGGGEDAWSSPAVPQHTYVTGIVLGLAAILMFFLALTSSFVVRKGLSNDWAPLSLPPVLWVNTLMLVASSLTLELARSGLRRRAHGEFRRWWSLTAAMGLAFLVGQVLAWRQLVAAGVYMATNPSSSFFYLMTGAHGLHLLGGVIALLFVGFRRRNDGRGMRQATATKVAGIYWHFMGILWVYLFLLLLLGQ